MLHAWLYIFQANKILECHVYYIIYLNNPCQTSPIYIMVVDFQIKLELCPMQLQNNDYLNKIVI